MAGVLLLSACAAGPIVSDDFEEDIPVEEAMAANGTDATGATEKPVDPSVVGTDAPVVQDLDDEPSESDEEEVTLVTNPPKPTPSTTTTTTTITASLGGPRIDPGLLPFVDQAKADLAGRLGVGAGTIVVLGAELVEWPDTSLGCPQPGMVYMQVPTDGSLIVLSHGGAEYRYHTGGSEYVPFLCE